VTILSASVCQYRGVYLWYRTGSRCQPGWSSPTSGREQIDISTRLVFFRPEEDILDGDSEGKAGREKNKERSRWTHYQVSRKEKTDNTRKEKKKDEDIPFEDTPQPTVAIAR